MNQCFVCVSLHLLIIVSFSISFHYSLIFFNFFHFLSFLSFCFLHATHFLTSMYDRVGLSLLAEIAGMTVTARKNNMKTQSSSQIHLMIDTQNPTLSPHQS